MLNQAAKRSLFPINFHLLTYILIRLICKKIFLALLGSLQQGFANLIKDRDLYSLHEGIGNDGSTRFGSVADLKPRKVEGQNGLVLYCPPVALSIILGAVFH